MKPFRVSIVQCRGTPYEVGRAQARLFAATPRGRAFLRRKTIKLPWWFNIRTEQRTFAKYSPALWEEIAGLAEGLDVPMERALLSFGNEGLRPPIGACSAVMTAGVYGRNYDFRPRHYGARLALVQATGSYASVGTSEYLTGRLDGMNEHGLTIGLHRVRKSPRFPGRTSVLLVRLVLDQCATTAEAKPRGAMPRRCKRWAWARAASRILTASSLSLVANEINGPTLTVHLCFGPIRSLSIGPD